MTKRLHRIAVAVAVVGGAFCAAGPAAAIPAVDSTACAYAPASIAVVVDFGDSSPLSAVCVPANSTDNGAAVLAARAEQLGRPAPRFNSSGLLCAIDGVPSEGCGEQIDSKYAYWSYWHSSSGSWSYSSVGPGGARVHDNVAEGWRFQPHGAGNPSDPPPRGSADPDATCVTAPPTTTAGPTSTIGTNATTKPLTSVAGDQPVAVDSPPSDSSTTTSTSSTSSAPTERADGAVHVATPDKGGGPAAGLLAGGGLVAALGAAGAIVARRRRVAES